MWAKIPKLLALRIYSTAFILIEGVIAMPVIESDIPDYLSAPFGPDNIPEDYGLSQDQLQTMRSAALAVETLLALPKDGLFGYYSEARKYGTTLMVDALSEVGRIWHLRGKVPAIGIGDMSQKGGGEISGHGSHRLGVDVDIRPLQKNGQTGPITWRDANYSRELTQELADILHANGKFAVEFIFFNDPNVKGVRYWANHDNHLHARFLLPVPSMQIPQFVNGSRHPAIRDLQRRLNFWIEATPAAGIEPISIDGDFGGGTFGAVTAFQRAAGLPPDGVVGSLTWQLLPVAKAAVGMFSLV